MFDKIASATINEAFDLGVTSYGVVKQAANGSIEAQRYLKEAMESGMMPMGGAPMAGGAPPPMPIIACPQCGTEGSPTPEGLCPVCGFDFNTLMGETSPEAGMMPAPSPEEIAAAEGQMKMAAINDINVMRYLMTTYGGWTEA